MRALTPEERDKISLHLKKKGHNGTCSRCRSNEWTMSDPVSIHLEGQIGQQVPAVLLVCINCGLIEAYSAKVLGIR